VVLQTVNVRLSPEQIAYTIDHAGSSTLLVIDEFVDLVHSILPQLSKVKRLVVLTDRKAPATGKLEFVGEYEELLGAASPDFEFNDFDENAPATTFYTTGTTGLPKGVYYRHRQLVPHAIAELAMFGLAAKQGRSSRRRLYADHADVPRSRLGLPVGGHACGHQASVPRPLRSSAACQADQDGRRDLHPWRADALADAA
jgi:fatty-acyl-CoA synthase